MRRNALRLLRPYIARCHKKAPGTEDFLLEHNRAFRSHAEQVGYRLTYKESAGGHSWDRWDDQIRKVLIWMGFKPAP